MAIRDTWKTALVVSLGVALVIASIEYFIFSGGTIYIAKVEWSKVEEMPYGEAQDYLAARVENISNFRSVMNGTAYKEFWLRFLYEFYIYFLLSFASCLLLIKIKQSNKALNQTPESGAALRGKSTRGAG